VDPRQRGRVALAWGRRGGKAWRLQQEMNRLQSMALDGIYGRHEDVDKV
jgi:hypothetical protein